MSSSDLIDATIESLGGLGDGIATYKNKPLFISKSCIGDHIRVRIVEEKADNMRGDIVEILAPGEHRMVAPCRYYKECGGCSLQHFTPDYYRQFKRRNFLSALKQGGFPDFAADMIFLGAATRRRVEFKWATAEKKLAYYRGRSHDLVPVDHCLILEPALQKLVEPLAEVLAKFPDAQHIKSVSLTHADSGFDMVLSFSTIPKTPGLQEIVKTLGFQRISIVLPDGHIQTVAESSPVEMRLGKYAVPLPPDAFLQAAREAQTLLTDHVLQAAQGAKNMADLFCGIGTYSFPLTDIANIHAIELDASMVKSMESSIKRYTLGSKISTAARDLFKNPLTATELKKFDTVVINPPRLGAKKQCEELAESDVKTVIMVSCNGATWARDAKALKNGGFNLTHAMGIDQFVYSPHFEIVSVFKR